MPRMGIVGAGQLARMLVEAALAMGISPHVYAQSESDCAVGLGGPCTVGGLGDRERLAAFFSGVDLVLFESEFADPVILREASLGLRGLRFCPGIEVFEALREKSDQKRWCVAQEIPTAEFDTCASPPREWLRRLRGKFPAGAVLKWSRQGYDGKGVCFLDDEAVAVDFCERGLSRGGEIYAEARVAFVRELAVVACRGGDGNLVVYPPVVSQQKDGVCWRVIGPASAAGVAEATVARAREIALRVGHAAGIIGTYAVELFETSGGEVLVNELAPRVHNSGHFSQDACATSQFENHLRAALGWPLGEPLPAPVFVMQNLLGPDGVTGTAVPPPPPSAAHFHWYGKSMRPGRKLGHLNAVAGGPEELPALLARVDRWHGQWIARMKEGKGASA